MSTRAIPVGWGIASVLLAIILIVFGWIGPTNSDDLVYAAAAHEWVHNFPYVSDGHHGLRHTIVLPMATLFFLFGENEATLAAPLLLYLGALLLMTVLCLRQVAGGTAGLLGGVLIVLIPIVSSGVSVVTTDLPEAFFCIASLWAFYFGVMRPRWWLFIVCGVLAGLGVLTRETTVALLVLYGLLFLGGFGTVRANYLWIGAGFLAVLGMDTLGLWWGSGDPLWRYHVSLRGVARDNPSMAGQFATTPGFDRFGAIAAPRWLQLPVVLFLNQSFGLYFWLAIPLALAALRRDAITRRITGLFGGLALLWAGITGYVLLSLWVLARYELVTAVALAVPAALTLAWLIHRRSWPVAAVVLAVLVVANAGLVGATNREPLFGERALVAFTRQSETPVVTDPTTFAYARWLLEVNGLSGRAETGPPRLGALYVFHRSALHPWPVGWPVTTPPPGWTEVDRVEEGPRWTALAIEWLGIRHAIPPMLLLKVDPPRNWAAAYRAG